MLNQTASYALRAVLALARQGGCAAPRPLRADEIAERTGAPRNYMGKTLNALVKEGILRSARGPAGGFTLALAPEAITVARVADVFTERAAASRCLLGGGACDPTRPCTAHLRWTAVTAAARDPFLTTTIADLAAAGR